MIAEYWAPSDNDRQLRAQRDRESRTRRGSAVAAEVVVVVEAVKFPISENYQADLWLKRYQ